MKKSLSSIKNKKKEKSFSFFTRITTLFIIAAAIIISAVFSFIYLDANSNLSIEFAGGYQTQVKYDGIYESDSKPQKVVNLLENRVDPLGTSNIIIEKSTSTGNFYNVSISKSAGIDLPIFINNIARRGYIYLLDSQGHDLLANNFDAKDEKWTKKEERIISNNAFSKIYQDTNSNSGQPEVVFDIKDQNLLKTINEVIKKTSDSIYFYSDIGGLLNYIRNTLSGLQDLVEFIDKTDLAKQAGLKALLANNTPGFEDSTGERLYNAVKRGNPNLINLLNQTRNGVYMINWKYSDALDNIDFPLSVDTNNKDNTFDPEKPFDPKENKGSPLNAWLPHIKDLIILPDISKALNTAIINYKYAPYYIGNINLENIGADKITINDDIFNKEKVQQIVNVLNAGIEKNNFTVLSVLNIDPTLGAQSLKVAVIGLIISLSFLSLAIIFNYRLLGVSAVLIILLFLLSTLVTFTFLNNVVAPETGIALIIGFALLLDTIVSLFNSIQREYKSGKTVFDAFKVANRKSLVSAFDCSVIVLIVSLTIFWFGSRSIRGFAIMTSLSTFGVILFGVLFLRLILYFLLKNNTFEKKPELLALKHDTITTNKSLPEIKHDNHHESYKRKKEHSPKKVNKKLAIMKIKLFSIKKDLDDRKSSVSPSKWNFWHKSAKWIMVWFGVIFLLSGTVYFVTGSNFGSGFDSRIDFTGQTAPKETPDVPDFDLWRQANELKSEVVTVLTDNHKSYKKIYASLILDSLSPGKPVIKVIIETNIKASEADDFLVLLNRNTGASWVYTINNALSGNQLFKGMLFVIAISLITIFIYVIIRFQLTFTIPLIVSLISVVFVTLALLALLQITISTMTIGVILALVVLVLINSVVIFDNIKEIKLNNHEKRNKLTKEEIIAISNDGIKKSLSRTLAVNSIIILTALVVLCFLPSFWSISLALILGTIVTFITSHFIGPWLWTFCERWRIKHYKKRAEKIKKDLVGPDEYIIEGIND
ncbi:MAG: protein translocase subunit SecDF [Spiroplasma sp.]